MARKTLDDKARGANHQGIMAKVKPAKQLNENDLDDIIAQTRCAIIIGFGWRDGPAQSWCVFT